MKRLNYFLLLFSIILFIGCNKDIEEVYVEPSKSFVNINGVDAILPLGYDVNDFKELNSDELFANIKFSPSIKNARTFSQKDERVTELYAFILKEKEKYPNLSKESISKNDLQKIMKDFPSLKDENSIRDQSNEVFLYYNAMVRKAIADKYNIKKARPAGIIDDFFQYQIYLGVLAGVNLLDIYIASNDAGSDTYTRYGTNRDNGKNDNNVNIYEHCLWNAYGIRNMIITGRSKSAAISLMADVTYLWELKNHPTESIMFNENAAVMDLKNNLAARTYMQDEVRWGVWVVRKWPSKEEIRAYFGPLCDSPNNYIMNSTATSIKALYGSNATTVLKFMYDYSNRSLVALAAPAHVYPI